METTLIIIRIMGNDSEIEEMRNYIKSLESEYLE